MGSGIGGMGGGVILGASQVARAASVGARSTGSVVETVAIGMFDAQLTTTGGTIGRSLRGSGKCGDCH